MDPRQPPTPDNTSPADLAVGVLSDAARGASIESERLALVATYTTNAVVIADPSGRIEWVNPAFTRFTGYELAEVLGQRPRDLLRHPEMDPALQAEINAKADRGEGFRAECPVLHKSGALLWAEVDIRPVRDARGVVTQSVGVYTDVTKRKLAEQQRDGSERALRRSEERYRSLFESSPVPMWVYDRESLRFLAVNDAAIEKYGFSRDEFLRMTIHGIRTPEEASRLTAELRTTASGPRRAGVWRHRTKAGDEVLADIASHGVTFEGREARLVIAMDVTARERAQEEILQWRLRYEAAVWSSGQVLYDWDLLSDRVVWAGDSGAILGYRAEDLGTSVPWHTLVHPDDLPAVEGELQRTAAHGSPFVMQYRVRRRDGAYMHVSDTGHYIKDDTGRPVRLIGFIADVTERHLAEATRRRLEQEREALVARLKMQLERMPIACIVFDKDLRFLDINPAAESIFGYRRDEAVGRSAMDLIVPPSAHSYVEMLISRLAAGDMKANGHNQNCTRDGRLIECEWTNTPLTDETGRFVGVLSMVQDVTERQRLENQLRHSQKLEAVGQLASGVAHDFNNLLTAIFGYLSLAKLTIEADHPAIKALAQVEEAAKQAAGVTGGLLTFSRKAAADKAPLKLAIVVNDAVKLLRRTLPASIRLSVDTAAASEATILADATQIQQIITNLAINSRDAMPDGGELRIALTAPAPVSSLPVSSAGDWVQLTVADTGTGMTPDVRARIFEPFFTTKERGHGTGLGLSILHGIVEEHGGHIQVESAPGQGTTFSIAFPAVGPGTSLVAATAVNDTPAGHGETILVGEDHQLVREIICAALRSVGYEVVAVGDGPAVLRSMQELQNQVKLLVLDIDLPGMNGLDCLRELKTMNLRRPTVVITGRTTGLEDVELDETTVLLRKPFQVGQLAELVGNVIAGARGGRA
ncbi:MAG: PAS domain S-box protein [Phycisphaerales bacterium]|nr:PAS domain S-box protein [Phycisphaerales bacterium]